MTPMQKKQIEKDVYQLSRKEISSYVMSILSDAHHVSHDISLKNRLINTAKYVIAKHLGGK